MITNPEKIKHWFSGANAESEWKEGSLVSFSGEWNGNEYEDKGIIMQVILQKVIQFSYCSTFSGLPDKPENYSIVTFRIEGKGPQQYWPYRKPTLQLLRCTNTRIKIGKLR